MTRVLSLCSGIGGLELAFPEWQLAAVAEIDPQANEVLRQRFPLVPNLGDWTALDTVDPIDVDVITAGLPCQPVSTAGRQRGADDERWLFDDLIRLLKRTTRKPWLFLENVPGIRSRSFNTEMNALRASLDSLGYSHREIVVKASEAGAPHVRGRWWMLATHPDTDAPELDSNVDDRGAAPRYTRLSSPISRDWKGVGHTEGDLSRDIIGDPSDLLKTPTADSQHRNNGKNLAAHLLPPVDTAGLMPTPMANQSAGNSGTKRDDTRNLMQRIVGLPQRLLPTSTARDSSVANDLTLPGRICGGPPSRPSSGIADDDGRVDRHGWKQYQQAVDQWTDLIGRPPPELVVMPTGKGTLAALHHYGLTHGPSIPADLELPELLRLINPQLPEWMMGYPYGWVTELLEPRPALKAIGNGVCPQQARLAASRLFTPDQPAMF